MLSRIACSVLAINLLLATACGEDASPEIPIEDVDALLAGKADSARTARFETFTGRDGRFYFHLLAANGQKVLHSQGYTSARAAGSDRNRSSATMWGTSQYETLYAVIGHLHDGAIVQRLWCVNGVLKVAVASGRGRNLKSFSRFAVLRPSIH